MNSVLLHVEKSMVVLGTSYHHTVATIFEHEKALRIIQIAAPRVVFFIPC